MRIALATDTYLPSVNGAAYFTARLAQALSQRGHEVFVLAPAPSMRSHIREESGVKVFGLGSFPAGIYPNLRIPMPFLYRRAIERIFSDLRPEVVHVQNHFFIGRAATEVARSYGIPAIGTNHFVPETILAVVPLPESARAYATKTLWEHFCSAYNQLGMVTAPSEAAVQITQNAGICVPMFKVSNGVDLDRFNGPCSSEANREPPANFAHAGPIVVSVCRLDREKRLDVVLRATRAALRRHEMHLIIAGSGRDRPALEALARDLAVIEHVTFTGFVSDADLPSLYRAADCFVMAGECEMQSIATLEAMASGLPIIAADSAALPELVKHGENGLLFAPNDWQDLSRVLTQLLTNKALRTLMGRKSREIAEGHNITATAMQFETLYDYLVRVKSRC